MDGRELERLVELSIDGELDPADEATLSRELEAPDARARFERERSFHDQLRLKLQVDSCASPQDLRARVVHSLRSEEQSRAAGPWGRATAGTLAVATLVVGSIAISERKLDPEEVVAKHILDLPPTHRVHGDSEEIRRLFAESLDFPLEVPRLSAQDPNVRFVGARVDEVENHDAAYLIYDHRGSRVSVFVYGGEGELSLPSPEVRTRVDGLEVEGGRHRNVNFVEFRSTSGLQIVMVSQIDIETLLDMVEAFSKS
ncbi:MAG: hypothetical protein AAGD10_04740 [Myxococcota bacterium]